jgi:hypothetical protein
MKEPSRQATTIPDEPNTSHLPSPARSFLAEANDAYLRGPALT